MSDLSAQQEARLSRLEAEVAEAVDTIERIMVVAEEHRRDCSLCGTNREALVHMAEIARVVR